MVLALGRMVLAFLLKAQALAVAFSAALTIFSITLKLEQDNKLVIIYR